MYEIEIGANLYHTGVLFIIVWGVLRFWSVLGEVAKGQSAKRARNEAIKFTK